MRNGHRTGRPWGLYAAVAVSVLAGMVILSQLVMGTHRDHGQPSQPTPAGTIRPVPLWTPPAQESHGEPSGARIYLSVPNPAG